MCNELAEKLVEKENHEKMIYHYTTIDTLNGLINGISKNDKNEFYFNFWASQIFAMNDPSELKYGYSVIQKWMPQIENELNVQDEDRLSRLLENAEITDKLPFYKDELEKSIYEQQISPFIISFSKEENNLEKYRMYANDATGVCLAFSYGEIRKITKPNKLYEVYYNKSEKLTFSPYEMLTTLYKKYIENNNREFKFMLEQYMTMVIITAAYIKKDEYNNEKEVRYLELRDITNNVKFRTSKYGNIIPYIEVPIPFNALKKIYLGPNSNSMTKYMIEFLFRSKGITNIPSIKESKLSYRKY